MLFPEGDPRQKGDSQDVRVRRSSTVASGKDDSHKHPSHLLPLQPAQSEEGYAEKGQDLPQMRHWFEAPHHCNGALSHRDLTLSVNCGG